MNKVVLMGRLTRDPEVRYSAGENSMAVARYTLAVDRRIKREGDAEADFISCVTFGKNAEFVEKYLHQGMRITISGRIQTGSYTNRDGNKVYTTDVVVEEHEFAESKNAGASSNASYNRPNQNVPSTSGSGNQNSGNSADGFMNIPEGLDEELPFN